MPPSPSLPEWPSAARRLLIAKSLDIRKTPVTYEELQELTGDIPFTASSRRILDTVGVPKGSFYNYFQSKEDYAAQVLELFDQRLLHVWNNAWASHEGNVLDGIRSRYQALIRCYDNNQYRDGCLIGNLTSEVGSTAPLSRTLTFLLDDFFRPRGSSAEPPR